MKKITLGLIALSSVSTFASIDMQKVKTCESGEAPRSLCLDLHDKMWNRGLIPNAIKDKTPIQCFVSDESVNPSESQDSVVNQLGLKFRATLRTKTFSATAANQNFVKTVNYIVFDDYVPEYGWLYGWDSSPVGSLTGNSNLEKSQVFTFENAIQTNRRSKTKDWDATVYSSITMYKDRLLLLETYAEDFSNPLRRTLKCFEIK